MLDKSLSTWKTFISSNLVNEIIFNKWLHVAVTFGETLKLYFNNYDQPVLLSHSVTVNQNGTKGNLFFGAGNAKYLSLKDALVQDFVFWNRYLFPFETGRLIGYTSQQAHLLKNADQFWTTDRFMTRDANIIHEYEEYRSPPSVPLGHLYSLKTLYQPKDAIVGKAFNFVNDMYNKSEALYLKPDRYGYVFLGNKWKSNPTNADIDWGGQCLTDPQAEICQINGLSVSMCLKIMSVSRYQKPILPQQRRHGRYALQFGHARHNLLCQPATAGSVSVRREKRLEHPN